MMNDFKLVRQPYKPNARKLYFPPTHTKMLSFILPITRHKDVIFYKGLDSFISGQSTL